MKKSYFIVALCLMLALAPLTALAETMYVNTPNGGSVNMRTGPSSDDPVMTSIPYAEPVQVIEWLLGGSYVNVSYNGYYGYVNVRYLSEYEPPAPGPLPTFVPAPTVRPTRAPTARPNPKPTATHNNNSGGLEATLNSMFAGFVNTSYEVVVVPSTPTTYVNLRWAPSKSAPVRSQYWANQQLTVVSENGAWCELYDPQTGIHGFMMSNFVSPINYGVVGSDS